MYTGVLAGLIAIASLPIAERAMVTPSVRRALECDGVVKVWVFLRDKGLRSPQERDEALVALEKSYPARATERRQLRRTAAGLFDDRDLPICGEYLSEIERTGVQVGLASSWVNAVSATASAGQITAIESLPFVERIAIVRRGVRLEAAPLRPNAAPPSAGPRDFYGFAAEQLAQIGISGLHSRGYTGAGVVIGVLDTGFALTHAAYANPEHPIDVIAEWDFINNDGDVGIEANDPPNQFFHGTAVLGAIAAYRPFELVGGAFDASFILAKTEDVSQEVPAEEDQYVAGLQFIEFHGGDVATSSLGYIDWYDWYDLDGETAVTTIAVNVATQNGVVCCTGAGNRGRDNDLPSLMAPSDAFEVLSCGAARADGEVTDFSSNGPTADGRVKPEVLARGEDVATVDPFNDFGYQAYDGTSMATPLVASAAALMLQVNPRWTVAQIRSRLFRTASYYQEHGTFDPEHARGYGLIDVLEAARPPQVFSP
jgi:subtilisin family serine protease